MFLNQITLKDVKIKSLQDVVNYLKANRNVADLIPEFMKLIRLVNYVSIILYSWKIVLCIAKTNKLLMIIDESK